MADQEVNQVNENKTAEVAPYMSTNKNNVNDTSDKISTVVPVIISLVVAVVIVASFFEEEYKYLMVSLNFEANTGEKVITTDSTIGNDAQTLATIVNARVTTTAATAPSTQPGLITVYNPYLKPYPQVYAPIPPQAPYGMPPQQAKAYTDMMLKRQKAVAEMIEMRNAALFRVEKNRVERMQQMEQQRAQAQKAYADMLKRRQKANRI